MKPEEREAEELLRKYLADPFDPLWHSKVVELVRKGLEAEKRVKMKCARCYEPQEHGWHKPVSHGGLDIHYVWPHHQFEPNMTGYSTFEPAPEPTSGDTAKEPEHIGALLSRYEAQMLWRNWSEVERIRNELIYRFHIGQNPAVTASAKCPKCGSNKIGLYGVYNLPLKKCHVECANPDCDFELFPLSIQDFAQFFIGATDRLPGAEAIKELLLRHGFASVHCGNDGLKFYECRECRFDEGHEHPAKRPEQAKHTDTCKLRTALAALSGERK